MEAHAVGEDLASVEDAESNDPGVRDHVPGYGDGERLLRGLHVELVGVQDPAFGENLSSETWPIA